MLRTDVRAAAGAEMPGALRWMDLDEVRRDVSWNCETILDAFWKRIAEFERVGKRVQVGGVPLKLERDSGDGLRIREDSAKILVGFVHDRWKQRVEREAEAIAKREQDEPEENEGYRPW